MHIHIAHSEDRLKPVSEVRRPETEINGLTFTEYLFVMPINLKIKLFDWCLT